MTDGDFLLATLRARPGQWVAQSEINQLSNDERGHYFTIHSRAADLRKLGHIIECKVERSAGRRVSFYRLTLDPAATSLSQDGQAAGSSGAADRDPLGLGGVSLEPAPEAAPLGLFDAPAERRPAWA